MDLLRFQSTVQHPLVKKNALKKTNRMMPLPVEAGFQVLHQDEATRVLVWIILPKSLEKNGENMENIRRKYMRKYRIYDNIYIIYYIII